MRTQHHPWFRRTTGIVFVALVLGACAGDTDEAPTTTAPTTTLAETTTSPPPPTTTTTTTVPLTIAGAPEDLVAAVGSLYGDRSAVDRNFSDHIAGATAAAEGPLSFEAVIAAVGDEEVAVVTDGTDLILAVGDGDGAWTVVGGSLGSLGVSPWYGTGLIQLYVIGSDARPGEKVTGMRADSHHIVTIEPDGSAASIVGLPRDTLVTTPEGTRGKFTNVMASHGPERVVATAEILTGLEFQGYLVTGFKGFVDLVDEFGGFDVDVPVAMNDRDSKANLRAGVQWLMGADMLAFARNRKSLAGGDFTRQFHHGVIMQWGLAATQGKGVTAIPSLLDMLTRHTITDLTATELAWIAGAIGHLEPFEVTNVVVPARHGSSGGAYVAVLTDQAFEIFATLADGPYAP
jgi:polyisoprenyl-teichoic acid--peptidoglycan teichoic acid transferase